MFIDPTKQDYNEKIKTALRQVVIEANEPPEPYVFFKKQKVIDSIYTDLGQLVLIADALDVDSPSDQLKFDWELNTAVEDGPLLNITRKSGKNVEFYIDQLGEYKLSLIVDDGVNREVKNITLIVKRKPSIQLAFPTSVLNTNFSNNTYHLYSYHRYFKFNDFSTFGIIGHAPIKNYVVGTDDWLLLIPNVAIVTTAYGANNITISSMRVKRTDDSIGTYKENVIPTINLFTEKVMINYDFIPLAKTLNKQAQPRLIYYPSESNQSDEHFTYDFSIYQNKGERGKIRIPSTASFKIVANDQGIQNSDLFQVKFHKVSRFSPYLDYAFMFANLTDKSTKLLLLGLGIEYILIPQITFSGCAGIQNPFVAGNPYIETAYYYKIDANFGIVTYKDDFKAFVILSDIHRPSYYIYPNYFKLTKYNSRPGIGFSIQPTFDKIGFPATLDLFYMHYISNDEAYNSFNEIGFKVKLYIIK